MGKLPWMMDDSSLLSCLITQVWQCLGSKTWCVIVTYFQAGSLKINLHASSWIKGVAVKGGTGKRFLESVI
jgi:hypothetical protein